MPARRVQTLAVLCALLILAAGTGSALLLAGQKPPAKTEAKTELRPGATGMPTQAAVAEGTGVGPTGQVVGATATPVPSGGVATVPPTNTSTNTPSPTRGPTGTPYPTPKPEKAGGPVLLPNNHKGVRWVTLQAGHWHNENLPAEMAHLVNNTGAYAGGVSEVDVNVAVAKLAAQRLYERGYSVEILDATVPPNYTTDLFLALHADGNAYSSVRGFKATSPWDWQASSQSEAFVGFLYEEYGKATGLPTDPRTSPAMANYYAFNPVRYRHALNPAVPAALIEMGFVTNPQDRQVLATEQDRLAWGIANAVDRYFRSGAAGPTPSPYPTFTRTPSPTRTATSTGTPTPTSTLTSTSTSTPTATSTAQRAPAPPTGTQSPSTTVIPSRTPSATRTPRLPTATRTPLPTSTPLTGTITVDGRWLPPVAPNGRWLPPLGSKAAPVLLDVQDDDPHEGAEFQSANWHPHIWRLYYYPDLGRSVWVRGEAIPPKE